MCYKILILLFVMICTISCISAKGKAPGIDEIMDMRHDMKDIALHYETHGTGDPILCLHGFGANLYSWRHLVEPLSPKHRLIMVDLKGHGLSPKPRDNKYSIYHQAAIILNFIDKQDLKNLTLIGHSFGGGVALATAITLIENEPGLLKKLILIDNIAYEQPLPFFIKLLRTPLLGSTLPRLLSSKSKVKMILKLAYYDNEKITEDMVEEYAKAIAMPGGNYALRQTAEQLIPNEEEIHKFTSRFSTINVPTLIIWGREDRIVPLEVGQKLEKNISNSEFHIIDSCGHIPHEERTEKSLPLIEGFINSNTISAEGENQNE